MLKSRFDRRLEMLEGLIEDRIQLYEMIMLPDGTQPPLTEQLTRERALAFWKKHRFTELGKRVLEGYSPRQVAELDSWLSESVRPL